MFRTLPARLTILYTLLFAILALVVFKIVDYSLETSLLNRIDADFVTDGLECQHIYQQDGLEGVINEIHLETTGAGNENMFMRIYDADLHLVHSSDLSHWSGLSDHNTAAELARREAFSTLTLPDNSQRVRIFFQPLADGYLLQFGKLLSEDEKLLSHFRRMFYLSFLLMLMFGGVFGFYVAKRALVGVHRVQQSAEQISRGNLSQRINFTGGSEEIRNLTRSFNRMQNRIQSLISELRDVTNNVAHDLRSPVTRIRGMAETTLTGQQSLVDYREMTGDIIEECDRIVGMINVMLEIAETDSGLRPLTREPVDLRQIIRDVTDLYSSVAQDRGIHLTNEIASGLLILRGDRSRLQRALANILDNAIKFTPDHGEVVISVRPLEQDIRIIIDDTGPGIPAEDLPRIFERFFRGDQSRSTPGSGLGLSLVDSIVRAHGGHISVSNREPCGTRVELTFPV